MSRRFTFRSLMLSLLALLSLGIASQAVAQTRIMPLGDSITAAPGCWRAYLWTQLQTAGFTNIDFVGTSTDRSGCGFAFDMEHEGHSGFSITGIADQNLLPAWLTSANPSIVIVHLGTNDMWGHFITTPTKLTALTKLIGQMRAHNAGMKIIVAQIIPMDPTSCTTCNADVIEFNNALPAWAAGLTTTQSPITLVNQFAGFDVGADTFDRVHPVDSGFQKMAGKFFPAVVAALNGTPLVPLAVVKAGVGTGTVTSNPAGINCGTACSAGFTNGTSVTLTAVAAAGSTFAGWSGACSGTGTCTVSMTQSRSVTATFNVSTTFPLAVTRAGNGTGTVTSNPAGINCGTTCTANYASGTSVTLNAVAASGSGFAGWSGACTGSALTCTVSMTQARNVTATFNVVVVIPTQLNVQKAGTGTGTVTSNVGGINCGTVCVAFFQPPAPATVQLFATPAAGSVFAGWSGACTGTGACIVAMTTSRSVTATFNPVNSFPLTFTKMGTGFGSVSSNPPGLGCATTCTTNFATGTNVTLTATPASDSTFVSWGGACSGTATTCTVSMTQARNVTATFNLRGASFPLNVTIALFAGGGNVTSNPAGINCGTVCSANFASGTSVTLTATPIPGATFVSWTGGCTGTAFTCTVSMTQARDVTATFRSVPPPVPLNVTLAGTGAGTVTSNVGGINCPTTCSAGFESGNVTLTATPAAGSTFAGWSGACTGTGTCTVVMSQPRAVTATFNSNGPGGTCPNPITFTGNTGNFNTTGPACYRTNQTINGWGCYNFEGHTLTVSGVARTCGQMPLTRAADGYYYFAATAGLVPYAGIFAW